MSLAVRRVGWVFPLLLGGCIEAPSFEFPSATSFDPFETDGAPYDPTIDPDEVPDGDDAGGEGDGSGEDDGSTGDATTSGGDATTEGSDLTTGEGGETGGPTEPDPFPPSEPFGDDADELSLVGTWTVAWNPDNTPSWTLQISESGAFLWSEVGPGCAQQVAASGRLWTEDDVLVMHVETWDKRDPWPMEAVVGEPLARPFQMRMNYASALDGLGITGPATLVDLFPWEGRVYTRDVPGIGPAGSWTAFAELWAVRDGDVEATPIVRDTFTLDAGAGAQATMRSVRSWTFNDPPIEEAPVVATGSWYNQTPGQPLGMSWVAGVTHLYDEQRLAAFADDRVLYKGPATSCP